MVFRRIKGKFFPFKTPNYLKIRFLIFKSWEKHEKLSALTSFISVSAFERLSAVSMDDYSLIFYFSSL